MELSFVSMDSLNFSDSAWSEDSDGDVDSEPLAVPPVVAPPPDEMPAVAPPVVNEPLANAAGPLPPPAGPVSPPAPLAAAADDDVVGESLAGPPEVGPPPGEMPEVAPPLAYTSVLVHMAAYSPPPPVRPKVTWRAPLELGAPACDEGLRTPAHHGLPPDASARDVRSHAPLCHRIAAV